MSKPDLNEVFAKLSLKNGDVVFYDCAVIDGESIMHIESPSPDCDDVLFIPVNVPYGKTIHDVVYQVSKRQVTNPLLGCDQFVQRDGVSKICGKPTNKFKDYGQSVSAVCADCDRNAEGVSLDEARKTVELIGKKLQVSGLQAPSGEQHK